MSPSPTLEAPPTGPVLLVSPHLDDGAFSCGRLLASASQAVVATLFAARPPSGFSLTDWDRAAGFADGDDVIGARREEDRQALACLGAAPRWLELRDSQYGGAELGAVAARLRELLAACRPETVFIPLGLFHSDHRLAHAAALPLLDDYPGCRWFAYEDVLYRRIEGLCQEALAGLARRGLAPWPVAFAEAADARERKRAAVACYRSQLRALATPGCPGQADLEEAEAYWRLSPALQEPP